VPGTVKFKFYLTAREVIGSKELLIQIDEMKLSKAMELLRERLGDKASVIFNSDGSLKSHYTVIVNGKVARSMDLELSDGSEIQLLPPVGGG
jgi:MoaD family protein